MYKKYFYLLLILTFFIFIFFKLQNSHPPYNVDETSWFFHTVFFDELFLKTNLDKNLWLSFESFDHPQLSKYIFGAYLFSKNNGYAHNRDKLLKQYGRWGFYIYNIIGVSASTASKAILNSPFSGHINKMREVNLGTSFLSLIVLFLLCKMLTQNIFISIVFVFLLAGNKLFTQTMLIATPDAHYMLFILLAIFSYIKYIRSQRKLYLYLFAAFSGLSLTAKLAGAVILIAYVLYLLFRLFREKRNVLTNALKEFLAVTTIVAVIWTATNPAIVYAPVKSSILYFSTRIEKLESYFHYFKNIKDLGLINIQDRIYSAYCISLSHCRGYAKGYLFKSPFLNILFVFFGVLYLLQLMKKGNRLEAIFIAILLIVIIIGSAVLIPSLNWGRYYLPSVVFLWLLEFMGITFALNFVTKRLLSLYNFSPRI